MDVCYVMTVGEYDNERVVGVYTDLVSLKKVLPNYNESIDPWYGVAEGRRDECTVAVTRRTLNPSIQFATDWHEDPVDRREVRWDEFA